jgi:hypothetical protein
LPPYHRGEPAGSPAALLKSNLQELLHQLNERGVSKSAREELLDPLEHLAEHTELEKGSHWARVIFRSPEVFEQFLLSQPVRASLHVGGSFFIRKSVGDLGRPRVFYVLALSQTHVGLLRCEGVQAEPVELPKGVPSTIEEALAFEPPDHDLENRSSAGGSAGAMRRIRFGTGSEHEKERAYLEHFYQIVDRGLQPLVREPDTALILAGVEQDVSAYRGVSTSAKLLDQEIAGSVDVARDHAEILQKAYRILRAEHLKRQAAELAVSRERVGAGRFSTDPRTIVKAAFDGRIGELYLNETAENVGNFKRDGYAGFGKEDLLNLAAVQTVLHNGKLCEVPAEHMPERTAAFAIMRF